MIATMEMPLRLLVYCNSFCIIKWSKFALVEYFLNSSTVQCFQDQFDCGCVLLENPAIYFSDKKRGPSSFQFQLCIDRLQGANTKFFVTIATIEMPLKLLVYCYSFCVIN